MFRIFGHITCDSRHVIYVIWCTICVQYVYVGETANPLSLRIANHLSTIRCKRPLPVAQHFNSAGHTINDIRFVGVQTLEHFSHLTSTTLKDRRRTAETSWIMKLGTLEPYGLNLKTDLTTQRRVPFVTTYTPQIASFVNSLKSLVEDSFGFDILPSFKNSSNMRKILCSSKLPN